MKITAGIFFILSSNLIYFYINFKLIANDNYFSPGIFFSDQLSLFQDENLKKLVELNGSEDWKRIANLIPVSIVVSVLQAQIYTDMYTV